MHVNLRGKTALITGGARGLGRGFSLALAASGAKVIFTSRAEDQVSQLKSEFERRGYDGSGLVCDVTDGIGLDQLESELTRLDVLPDILINNVGHTLNLQSYDVEIEEWQAALKLNFLVHVDVTNRFLKQMTLRSWGRIVNITSIAGLEVSGPAPFNCAKAALTAYTRSVGRLLAIENPGIVMTAVAPGIVETSDGHWEKMRTENPQHVKNYLQHRAALKRFGTIEEITGIVEFLCSDYASFFHGAIVQVDGGQSRSYFPHTYLD